MSFRPKSADYERLQASAGDNVSHAELEATLQKARAELLSECQVAAQERKDKTSAIDKRNDVEEQLNKLRSQLGGVEQSYVAQFEKLNEQIDQLNLTRLQTIETMETLGRKFTW